MYARPLSINLYQKESEPKPQPSAEKPGLFLYIFYSLFTLTLLLAAFVLYDYRLYQGEYNDLVKAWNVSQADQSDIDHFISDLSLLESGRLSDDRVVVQEAREIALRLKFQEPGLKNLAVSSRYPHLLYIKKGLVDLNRGTYRLALNQPRLAAMLRVSSRDSKFLASNQRLNENLSIIETRVGSRLLTASPSNRQPLDGL